jgi:A/G-specific adenine glycosylase
LPGGSKFSKPAFRRELLAWYDGHQRDLPWRHTQDPYRILVSEVMLQQTRVTTVIPYYERFLEQFPDVAALARASEPELLAAWSGLGYYSRARNLQKAAQRVVEQGAFPDDDAGLRNLPGVGDYTAAAVGSIAFGLRQAAVDGNVLRVLSRLTGDPSDIGQPATRARFRALAQELLHTQRPGDFNQAVMELGATLCTPRNPRCLLCPVARFCEARKLNRQNELPIKLRPAKQVDIAVRSLLIRRDDQVLLQPRPGGSRHLKGFWELPEEGSVPARITGPLAEFSHHITYHRYRYQVWEAVLEGPVPASFRWARTPSPEFPITTATRKALAGLSKPRSGT